MHLFYEVWNWRIDITELYGNVESGKFAFSATVAHLSPLFHIYKNVFMEMENNDNLAQTFKFLPYEIKITTHLQPYCCIFLIVHKCSNR